MVLKRIEQKLEKLVEGTFTRAFPSSVKPIELGKRVRRVLEDKKTIGVQGQIIIPNRYVISLSPKDLENIESIQESIQREISSSIRDHANDENYHFQGTLTVEILSNSSLKTGSIEVDGLFEENKGGFPPGSLINENGERLIITEQKLSIGRDTESTMQVVDVEVSRNHAEIRLLNTSFVLIDLQSTNGTFVNGQRVQEHTLQNFDQIKIGSTILLFQKS
ncbi:MAG: FhaA domain-containing protein [Acidimicrobiales bacterium]